jgi:hypothetical protein
MKRWFNNLALREKIFFGSFVWILLLAWGLFLIKDFRQTQVVHAKVQKLLKQQDTWLKQDTSIKKRLTDVLARLNPEKTYDRNHFVGKVEELARAARLRFTSETPQTHSSDISDAHSMRISITNATLADLMFFDQLIAQEAPYLGLDNVRISANVRMPNRLNATFHLSAIQLKQLSNLQYVKK